MTPTLLALAVALTLALGTAALCGRLILDFRALIRHRRSHFHAFRCDRCHVAMADHRRSITCHRCGRKLEPLNF